MPLAVPEGESVTLAATRPVVLPDATAEAVQERRLRGLRVRLSVLAGIGLTVILVWALTGAPANLWPVWPLLGLALIGGLDAWRVRAGRAVRESDLVPGGERTAAIRSARRRRSLRLDAGLLAIIDLFLVGLWIATGGGYFWPVWPILGTALAIGLKALRWPTLARERLLDGASNDLAPR